MLRFAYEWGLGCEAGPTPVSARYELDRRNNANSKRSKHISASHVKLWRLIKDLKLPSIVLSAMESSGLGSVSTALATPNRLFVFEETAFCLKQDRRGRKPGVKQQAELVRWPAAALWLFKVRPSILKQMKLGYCYTEFGRLIPIR